MFETSIGWKNRINKLRVPKVAVNRFVDESWWVELSSQPIRLEWLRKVKSSKPVCSSVPGVSWHG